MSKVEEYRYDGSVRPDFQSLPTFAKPAGDLSETEAAEYTEFLKERAAANLAEIASLQRAFREAKKRGLVIILHGMPYSGKSETGRYLKKGMGKGVKLCSYDRGQNERDFLWQMHRRMPKYGKVCIMGGSVYSDIPDGEGRAAMVKAFEKYLKESGISVIRVFLHVSAKRQKKRMLEVITTKPGGSPREMPSDKNWRREYLDRFADTIAEAATSDSPWYIVPADSKWYLRCIVTELVRDELRSCVNLQAEESEAEEAAAEVAAEEEPAEVEAEAAVAEAAVEEEPAETEAEAAVAEAVVEEKPAEVEAETAVAGAAVEEKPAETAEAEPKKPARRTRRKKAETEAGAAEEKPAGRPARRQGPPKTVEETLAKRRRRNSSSNG